MTLPTLTPARAARLLRGIDPLAWLAYADWCEERGEDEDAAAWRRRAAFVEMVKPRIDEGWNELWQAFPAEGGRTFLYRWCNKTMRFMLHGYITETFYGTLREWIFPRRHLDGAARGERAGLRYLRKRLLDMADEYHEITASHG